MLTRATYAARFPRPGVQITSVQVETDLEQRRASLATCDDGLWSGFLDLSAVELRQAAGVLAEAADALDAQDRRQLRLAVDNGRAVA